MREAVSLRDLYAQYNDHVQFLVIYIREAHPVDGWDVGSANRIYDPQTIEERRKVAGMCEVSLQYGIGIPKRCGRELEGLEIGRLVISLIPKGHSTPNL